MGLFDKLFGEFIDVIEWVDDTHQTMIYRFERYGNEIKYGAKLTVREGQVAVFVNEGEVADVLGPGLYELETKNLPLLSTLQHWDHGFQSPFKAEVYFCSTKRFIDLKWGTRNPVMMRDKEFHAVRIRAYGTYATRIADPVKFMREITGTDGLFTVDEISDQLRNLITANFATVASKSGIPVLDMASNYDDFGRYITHEISPIFDEYGLELTRMLVENISLPPAVEEALDKRTSMGIVGDLNRYLQFQSAEAIEASADNASGAADAMSMGMGFAVANQMGKTFATSSQAESTPEANQPPPLPVQQAFHIEQDGAAAGPYSVDQLARYVSDGVLTPMTLVWQKGMVDWQPASQVSALAPLFEAEGDAPPPLPPR